MVLGQDTHVLLNVSADFSTYMELHSDFWLYLFRFRKGIW